MSENELKAAAKRVTAWKTADSWQEKYDIYRDHPCRDRIGGMDMQALQAGHQQDVEALADAYLSPPAHGPAFDAEPVSELETINAYFDCNWGCGCGYCSGQHRGNGSPVCPREPHHHCDEKCKGLARELARWPLTGVRVSDREPRHAEWSVWTKTPDTSGPYFPMTWHIPQEIFDFLPKTGGVTTGIRRAYPTREDAHAALSHAAVNYVRELAGLRALPRRDPERIFVDMTGRRHVSSIQFATMRAPSRLHGWREEPTGEITVTFTGDVRPFHGHVGKEVYLLVPGETSGPWMVLETEFTLPRFDEGRAVVVRLAGG